MLFTCKNFTFSDYTWKKYFCFKKNPPPLEQKRLPPPSFLSAEVETNISCSTVSFTTMIDPPSLELLEILIVNHQK